MLVHQVDLLALDEELFHLGAGFERITSYGNMTGAPFDPMESSNLVLTARLAGGRQDG